MTPLNNESNEDSFILLVENIKCQDVSNNITPKTVSERKDAKSRIFDENVDGVVDPIGNHHLVHCSFLLIASCLALECRDGTMVCAHLLTTLSLLLILICLPFSLLCVVKVVQVLI